MTSGAALVSKKIESAASADSQITWQLALPAKLPICDWDGDYIVYNPLSGDTHVLDVVTGEVLKLISAAPRPVNEVRHRIAAFLQVPDDDQVAAHVGSMLASLDEMGLIEPAAAC